MTTKSINSPGAKTPVTRQGTIFIISGPSGAGKTDLIKGLQQMMSGVQLAVSWTTRPPRFGEIPGTHYHFRTQGEFELALANGEFLEYANVHGNMYGTPRREVMELLEQGIDVILDIDVEGRRSVVGYDFGCKRPRIVSIFLMPASLELYKRQLSNRDPNADPKDIALRLKNAEAEMACASEYNFTVMSVYGERYEALSHVIEIIHGI